MASPGVSPLESQKLPSITQALIVTRTFGLERSGRERYQYYLLGTPPRHRSTEHVTWYRDPYYHPAKLLNLLGCRGHICSTGRTFGILDVDGQVVPA